MVRQLKARLQGPDVENENHRPTSDEGGRTGPESDGPEWIKLQQAVQNLPLDVNLVIRDALLEQSFGPGKEIVFPINEPSYLQHFRALDRQLLDKYHYIYYSQNMWFIEEGPATWLMQYAYEFMPYQFSQIRNLTLKWTCKDYCGEGLEAATFLDWCIEEGGTEGLDNLQTMFDFSKLCEKVREELEFTWWNKMELISSMELEYLVIDARDAFAPDGQYLGLRTAHDCNWTRFSNFPDHLRVLAPDNDLADQIYDILVTKSLS